MVQVPAEMHDLSVACAISFTNLSYVQEQSKNRDNNPILSVQAVVKFNIILLMLYLESHQSLHRHKKYNKDWEHLFSNKLGVQPYLKNLLA